MSDSELEVRNLAALILNISTNRRIARRQAPCGARAFISDAESRLFSGIEQGSSSINLGKDPTKERLEDLDLTQDSILHVATHAVIGAWMKLGHPTGVDPLPGRHGREDEANS